MTTTRSPTGREKDGCRKCGNHVTHRESDAVGIMVFCCICGNCTYLDHDGQEIEELNRMEKETTQPENQESTTATVISQTHSEGTPLPGSHEDEARHAFGLETAEQEAHPSGNPGTGEAEDASEQGGEACEKCGAASKDTELPRYIRLPLRQCADCGHWTKNPAFPRELDSPEEITGAIMQMYVAGTSLQNIREASEEAEWPEVRSNHTNLWRTRYLSYATEKMRELRPKTGISWQLGHFMTERGKKRHHCWSLMDTGTNFILAAVTSAEGLPPDELMDNGPAHGQPVARGDNHG